MGIRKEFTDEQLDFLREKIDVHYSTTPRIEDADLMAECAWAIAQLRIERDAQIADNARLTAEVEALNYTLRKLEFERQAAFNDGVAAGRSEGES